MEISVAYVTQSFTEDEWDWTSASPVADTIDDDATATFWRFQGLSDNCFWVTITRSPDFPSHHRHDVDQETSVDVLYYVGYSYICVYPDSGEYSYPTLSASTPEPIYGPGYSNGY